MSFASLPALVVLELRAGQRGPVLLWQPDLVWVPGASSVHCFCSHNLISRPYFLLLFVDTRAPAQAAGLVLRRSNVVLRWTSGGELNGNPDKIKIPWAGCGRG